LVEEAKADVPDEKVIADVSVEEDGRKEETEERPASESGSIDRAQSRPSLTEISEIDDNELPKEPNCPDRRRDGTEWLKTRQMVC
jgi:hypothetical protein